jgi:acyl carrier protein
VTAVDLRSQIINDVSDILETRMGVSLTGPLEETTLFFADLGLASIDAVVLSEEIQAHYGRPLPFQLLMAEIGRRTDRDLSIGELVSFIGSNL